MNCITTLIFLTIWRITYSNPIPASLLGEYANKLTYKENEALPENFGSASRPKMTKSHISDFTDPATGFNPFLDLAEGPTGLIRARINDTRSTINFQGSPTYFKYDGGKDRHSKRDNQKPTGVERSPLDRRGFLSLMEGESSGRDRLWMPELKSKPTPTKTDFTSTENSPTNDYVTIKVETDNTTLEGMIEFKRPENDNSELEDGQSLPEDEIADEETNNTIATFLETKSFVYSLALICASVVFFAAVLTGMFVYRRKRRRLPGVHKKNGRFVFRANKRRVPKKEERILQDDFRVTVC